MTTTDQARLDEQADAETYRVNTGAVPQSCEFCGDPLEYDEDYEFRVRYCNKECSDSDGGRL